MSPDPTEFSISHPHDVIPSECCDTLKAAIPAYIALAQAAWTGGVVNDSRSRIGERGVWQRRHYQHTIRHKADLERCMNYFHVNPLKHGLVEHVIDYPWGLVPPLRQTRPLTTRLELCLQMVR